MPRIESVDSIRLLAVLGVIIIHFAPFSATISSPSDWLGPGRNWLISDQLVRFAVPCFFCLSGYFFAKKIAEGMPPMVCALQMIKRLMAPYFGWLAIYVLHDAILVAQATGTGYASAIALRARILLENPIELLFSGYVHLWFCPALASAALAAGIMLALFGRARGRTAFAALALLLYLLHLLGGKYQSTCIGIDIPFPLKLGPFLSTLPFSLGCLLAGVPRRSSWFWQGGLVFLVGFFLHFSEVILLTTRFGVYPLLDAVFGTALMGFGVTLVALSNHRWLQWGWISRQGKYAFGIYLSHMLVVIPVLPFLKIGNYEWNCLCVTAIFAASYIITRFLSATRTTKWLVA